MGDTKTENQMSPTAPIGATDKQTSATSSVQQSQPQQTQPQQSQQQLQQSQPSDQQQHQPASQPSAATLSVVTTAPTHTHATPLTSSTQDKVMQPLAQEPSILQQSQPQQQQPTPTQALPPQPLSSIPQIPLQPYQPRPQHHLMPPSTQPPPQFHGTQMQNQQSLLSSHHQPPASQQHLQPPTPLSQLHPPHQQKQMNPDHHAQHQHVQHNDVTRTNHILQMPQLAATASHSSASDPARCKTPSNMQSKSGAVTSTSSIAPIAQAPINTAPSKPEPKKPRARTKASAKAAAAASAVTTPSKVATSANVNLLPDVPKPVGSDSANNNNTKSNGNKTATQDKPTRKRKSRAASNETNPSNQSNQPNVTSPPKRSRKKKTDQASTPGDNLTSMPLNSSNLPPSLNIGNPQLLSIAPNAPPIGAPMPTNVGQTLPPHLSNSMNLNTGTANNSNNMHVNMNRLMPGLSPVEGYDANNRYFSLMISPYANYDYSSAASLTRPSLSRLFTSSSAETSQANSHSDELAKAFEELRDNTWSHLSKCILEQAQQFDVPSLIGTLYTLRSENEKLVNKIRDLSLKKEQLLAINARLDLPGLMLTQHLSHTSPNFSSVVSGLTNSPKSLPNSSPSPLCSKRSG